MLSIFGIALLLLCHGNALISVKTVELGEPGILTCLLPDLEYSNARVKWYKQSTDDTLVLITTLMKNTANPRFEKGFPLSRFSANYTTTMSTLTISQTVSDDEALYHCAITTWTEDQWRGTYLSLKGNIRKAADHTVAHLLTVSHPEDSVTLRCSVVSGSLKRSCPGEHSVHLFGARPDKSHAIIKTKGNRDDGCDKKSNGDSSPKSCVYHYSKNISSADNKTYYCAVATCGEILFGNGTKQDTEDAVSLQENVAKMHSKRDGEMWMYTAVTFNLMKTGCGGTRDKNEVDQERIYAAIKAFGWD
ncbi:uncharacterized protein LOC121516644 isoform X2 [Cheilinus undulatus]|uniref:uncharacterized protein LOC121516644 isoform X2 n=1 Tax=Cheilinus undulatus TaxID=241271 RepID=UPI001BD61E9E|nr:uncharacterized protein LOC121516644 isoform X2 [Cheilinus undulatus]